MVRKASLPRAADLTDDDLLSAVSPPAPGGVPDGAPAPLPAERRPTERRPAEQSSKGDKPEASEEADAVFLSVRVSRELRARLKHRALDEDRSVQQLVVDAVEGYLRYRG